MSDGKCSSNEAIVRGGGMIDPRDISSLREFLTSEHENRKASGDSRYIREAALAIAAFERIAARAEFLEREKQVREFDAIFGGPKG